MALNLKDHRILIVDDFREMRITLRGMLESLGARDITEARSGEDALEEFGRNRFDLVLCDYNLGKGRDGQQVLEEARHRGVLRPDAIWIMITAENTMDMVMAVVEYAPDSYLVKPINKAVLQVRLERILKRKSAVKAVEFAMAKRDYDRAVALCDDGVAKYPEFRLDLLKLKVEALLARRDPDAAAEICSGVLGDRDVPWALLALGRARHQQGDQAQALALFNQAISQNETHMAAYDWKARLEREMGHSEAAQKTLGQAASLSPKVIRRHQSLADMAHANGDYTTAANAYRKALALGANSCFSRPDDAVGLVDAVSAAEGPEAALKVANELSGQNAARRVRPGRSAQPIPWRITLARGKILLKKNDPGAAEVVAQALEGYQSEPEGTPVTASIDLARCCFQAGLKDEAHAIMDRLVREYHDRPDVIAAAQNLFDELDMKDHGAELIAGAQKAVVDINNEGVRLAQSGKLNEAIALLTRAADELPGNLTILLNVSHVLLLKLRAEPWSNQTAYALNGYLERTSKIDAQNAKLVRLQSEFSDLARKNGPQAVNS
ncbi:MAG: response regulator [Gammaproteobacteria bacterium]|nr:response regulator [Gammaproteobacteria bacterium]